MELDFCRSCFKVCIKKFCDVKSVTVEKNTAARYIERRIPIMTPHGNLNQMICSRRRYYALLTVVNYAEAHSINWRQLW